MDAENLSDDGAPPPTPKAKPKSKANKKPKASPKKVEVASPKKTVEKSKAKGGVKRRPAAATSGGADAEQEPGDGEPAEVMRRPAAKKTSRETPLHQVHVPQGAQMGCEARRERDVHCRALTRVSI